MKLTDRLAFIATKDGYVEFKPDATLGHGYGFADLAAGLKYALIDDRENQLIVTPGITVTLPTGNEHVFQSHGSGEENVFVSFAKGWDNFHTVGNIGLRIPNNPDKSTLQVHYSLQFDYYVHQYFIPFVALNGYTILSNGRSTADQALTAVPLNTEGYDLINFGSSKAGGFTQMTIGAGARSKITKNVDIGAAYEVGIIKPVGIFDSRVTADVSFHF
ncbi:MAG: transporter [Verrucomicrobiota bacterium]